MEKGPALGSKIGPLFWSLVYPKCSKLEVYNPRVMILDIFSIIYKSNDPQIFHLQNKLWLYKIIHEAWRMFWDYLVVCTLLGVCWELPVRLLTVDRILHDRLTESRQLTATQTGSNKLPVNQCGNKRMSRTIKWAAHSCTIVGRIFLILVSRLANVHTVSAVTVD